MPILPADYRARGSSGIHRPRPSVESSGTWRGLQLSRVSTTATFPAGTAFAAPFNHVDFQSDAIAGTSPVTIGGVVVPGNAYGVCPPTMEGLWRLGGRVGANWDEVDILFQQWGIKVNNVKVPVDNVLVPGSTDGGGVMFPLDVKPILVELVSGDVVWFYMGAPVIQIHIHGSDTTPLRTSWMLMEWLGPVPVGPGT